MTIPWPGGEDQQQSRRRAGADSMALPRRKPEYQPHSARDGLIVGRDLDLTADHRDPRMLVHLVILQALPGGNLQHDRTSFRR